MHQWHVSGGSEHLLEVLRDLYSMPWFSTEGLTGIMIPAIGALAGTPFADLLFIFATAKLLKTTRGLLIEAKFCSEVDTKDFEDVFGVTLSAEEKGYCKPSTKLPSLMMVCGPFLLLPPPLLKRLEQL